MGKLIPGENDFATVFPEIAHEVHPTLNGGLTAHEIPAHSNKKIYWLCDKQHVYYMSSDNRSKKKIGCPYCTNRELLQGFNDLATTYPQLARDWDYENNEKTPFDYTGISSYKASWVCHECGYRWTAKIRDRVDSTTFACPKCVLKIRGKKKSETALRTNGCIADKALLEDWDYDKNDLRPDSFTPQSNNYAWWKCKKCGYSWRAKISNRANGRGCPCCSNRIVVKGINDLATTHPELAEEWDYEGNAPLTPSDVSFGMGKKVSWICPNGHKFKATINHRSGGTDCPICVSGRQTSFAEQATYYYIKQVFPDALNRYQPDFLGRLELDIYIPSIHYAIEYDGIAWHGKDKLKREQKKYNLCHEHGIKLIRMREETPKTVLDNADYTFGRENLYEYKNLQEVICLILSRFKVFLPEIKIDVDIKRDQRKILGYAQELKGPTFESEYPEQAKEWDYEKNGDLLPSMFKPHSDIVVWWKCKECRNSYKASFGHRSYGTGCPKCGIKKSTKSRMKAVEMLDPVTSEVIQSFTSITEASKTLHINHSNIAMVCKGNRPKAGGYKWRYAE